MARAVLIDPGQATAQNSWHYYHKLVEWFPDPPGHRYALPQFMDKGPLSRYG